MGRRNRSKGTVAVAFAAGMIVAFICPEKWLITILAIAVILLGASFLKCCNGGNIHYANCCCKKPEGFKRIAEGPVRHKKSSRKLKIPL